MGGFIHEVERCERESPLRPIVYLSPPISASGHRRAQRTRCSWDLGDRSGEAAFAEDPGLPLASPSLAVDDEIPSTTNGPQRFS